MHNARIAAVYTAVSIAYTWPLARYLGTRVPNDLGDSLLNMFILAWNTRAVPLTASWWNAPQFFPAAGATAFSEHLVGFMPVANPIIWLTGNPIAAYNVLFLLSYALCGVATHALVRHLTGRTDAAFVAGIAFAFAPYRLTQLAHLQVLAAFWLPIALLCLHRYVETRRAMWALLFAGAWLMQALTCGYYVFYFSLLAGLWLLWFGTGPRRLSVRGWGTIAAAWSGAALLFLPFALGYQRWQQMYGMRRTLTEIKVFSADVAGVLTAPADSLIWGGLQYYQRAESQLFTGVTILVLIAAAIALAVRAGDRDLSRARRWTSSALFVLAIAAATAWIVFLVNGAIDLRAGATRLLSIRAPGRPLMAAVVALLAAIALRRSAVLAIKARSALLFYSGAAVVMALFAFGPDPTIAGRDMRVPGPYSLLLLLPGTDGVRVPARFWMLTALCAGVAAGVAAARLHAAWPRAARMLVPAAAVLIAIEGWPAGVKTHSPPSLSPAASSAPARLQLPLWKDGDIVALYRAIHHRQQSINGYSGYFPLHYEALTAGFNRRDPLMWTIFSDDVEVAVERARDPDGAWRRYIEQSGRARLARDDGEWISFVVAGTGAANACGGPTAAVRAVTGVDSSLTSYAIDGNVETRWHSGGQRGGEQLVLDLGEPKDLRAIGLPLHQYRDDVARELSIEVSSDASAWTETARVPFAAPYVAAALADPKTMPLCYPVAAKARYIRLTQTSSHPTFYWSVAEVIVYVN